VLAASAELGRKGSREGGDAVRWSGGGGKQQQVVLACWFREEEEKQKERLAGPRKMGHTNRKWNWAGQKNQWHVQEKSTGWANARDSGQIQTILFFFLLFYVWDLWILFELDSKGFEGLQILGFHSLAPLPPAKVSFFQIV
jgi:hypothetical protein